MIHISEVYFQGSIKILFSLLPSFGGSYSFAYPRKNFVHVFCQGFSKSRKWSKS